MADSDLLQRLSSNAVRDRRTVALHIDERHANTAAADKRERTQNISGQRTGAK
jgi:hypothetical protein